MWKVREEKKEEEISPTAGDVRTIDPRSQGELSTAALQPRPKTDGRLVNQSKDCHVFGDSHFFANGR